MNKPSNTSKSTSLKSTSLKSIPYIKKQTQANTEYRKTRSQDLNWVLEQCRFCVDIINACETDKGLYDIGLLLNSPNPRMPKQSTGKRNSPKSMCEGVLYNFSKGDGQYDLSEKTCIGIQEAFRVTNTKFANFETIEFIECTELPTNDLPIKKVVHSIDNSTTSINSTYNVLFDIMSLCAEYEININVTKK